MASLAITIPTATTQEESQTRGATRSGWCVSTRPRTHTQNTPARTHAHTPPTPGEERVVHVFLTQHKVATVTQWPAGLGLWHTCTCAWAVMSSIDGHRRNMFPFLAAFALSFPSSFIFSLIFPVTFSATSFITITLKLRLHCVSVLLCRLHCHLTHVFVRHGRFFAFDDSITPDLLKSLRHSSSRNTPSVALASIRQHLSSKSFPPTPVRARIQLTAGCLNLDPLRHF